MFDKSAFCLSDDYSVKKNYHQINIPETKTDSV